MKILVSLFHAEEKTQKLWVFDHNLKPLKSFAAEFSNIKGICVYEDNIYAGHKDLKNECSILIFSKNNFTFLKKIILPDVSDIHSIKIKEDQIYAVSSGSNRILVYDLNELIKSNTIVKPKKVITTSLTDTIEKDKIHLNAIFLGKNGLYVSGFGESDENGLWLSARNGFIININSEKERIVVKKLFNPHSIFFTNNNYWFCESGTKKVYNNHFPIIDTVGYTRGLFVEEKETYLFVGTSTSRVYENKITDINTSGVHKYIKGQDCFELEVSYFFNDKYAEIYDIISL